jgi:hypothetical protein
LRKN